MPYQCSTCNKAYSTASHLARHSIAHQPERHFQCPFCTKSYARQDIARRHSARCTERQGRPVIKPHGRGQPRKACDRCADAKISCDRASPCVACSKVGVQCSYHRLQISQSRRISTTTFRHVLAPEDSARDLEANTTPHGHLAEVYEERTMSSERATRVPFLLSYTTAEPSNPKDFADALETFKGVRDKTMVDGDSDADHAAHHIFPMLAPFFAAEMYQPDTAQDDFWLPNLTKQDHRASNVQNKALRDRASELITFVEDVGRTGCFTSLGTVAMLLTPENLALCVDCFFQSAYNHVPIVHRPSFDIGSTELLLLLAITTVGAVWSFPRDTYFMVFDHVEIIERCIFEDSVFQELREKSMGNANRTLPRLLALLQAATMLISISFAFPNPDHRRRFRDQRFSELISAVRQLQGQGAICDVAHTTEPASPLDWTTYVFRESCSRVIYYTYLLDCHISIVYATLPRLSVLEMKARLPSNESIFGAQDAETFQSRWKRPGSGPPLSLIDVVQCLMAADSVNPDLSTLTAFPLFLVVEAIQSMIFTSKLQLIGLSQISRFERALAHWQEVWNRSQGAHALFRQSGFMVHAEEVWLLAHKILRADVSKLVSTIGTDDMTQFRRWLNELNWQTNAALPSDDNITAV